MSVYTPVGREALAAWLAPLNCGELVEHAGIAAGMQNSNYFVDTTAGRFVLTLFEHLDGEVLDDYLELQSHLARRGIPCPQPLADGEGRRWRTLCGKPAALLTRLPGANVESPTPAMCQALGEMLARLHLAVADLGRRWPNPCGAAWREQTGRRLLPGLTSSERELLADELAWQAKQDFSPLPRGVVHADLFRDNVLWLADGSLSGILDFYFAGEDALLYDLAVVANDWCRDDTTLAGLFAGYVGARPLAAAELTAWPAMRRAAALRFWLLRLEVRQQPRAGSVVTIKDPGQFEGLLRTLRLAGEALPR